MTYRIPQGIQVSLGVDSSGNPTTNSNNMVWYKLSDHNRQPINITYTLIESTDRMANGTLRKFIVARKFIIKADWKDLPSLDSNLVDYITKNGDYAKGAAWIKAFYEGNYGNPIYVKLIFAKEGAQQNDIPDGIYLDSENNTNGNVYNAFMTTFTYNVTKRRTNSTAATNTGYDYVDVSIEFTEI